MNNKRSAGSTFPKKLWSLLNNKKLFVALLIYCWFAGAVYYGHHKVSGFSVAFAGFQNALQAMAFSADITVSDAYQSAAKIGGVYGLLQYLYIVAVCITPLMTIAVIREYLVDFINHRKKDIPRHPAEISIYGQSSISDNIIHSIPKDKALVYYMSQEISDWDKASYIERGIYPAIEPKYGDVEAFNKYHLLQSKYIVLADEDPIANFNVLGKIIRYFKLYEKESNAGNASEQQAGTKIMILCENLHVKKMYQKLFTDASCEKPYGKSILSNVDLMNIAPHKQEARRMIKDHPLYHYQLKTYDPRRAETPSFWNQHIVILGFGALGQEMVLQCMNAAVLHSQSTIRFDIYDSNMNGTKGEFLKNFALTAFKQIRVGSLITPGIYSRSAEDYLELTDSGSIDGILRIYFHEVDVNTVELEKSLYDINQIMPITYGAVCFADDENAVTAVMAFDKVLSKEEKENVVINLHLESDEDVCRFIDSDKIGFKNVKVSGRSNQNFNLDYLMDYADNFEAKKFHYIYKNLGDKKLNAWKSAMEVYRSQKTDDWVSDFDKVWNETELSNKESSRTIYQYQNNKVFKAAEYYYRTHINEMGALTFEDYFALVTDGIRRDCFDEIFKTITDYIEMYEGQTLVDAINKNAGLREFGAMEHRRWCNYNYTIGFEYSVVRAKPDKKHCDLLKWDDLSLKDPGVIPYDFMGYLLLDYK